MVAECECPYTNMPAHMLMTLLKTQERWHLEHSLGMMKEVAAVHASDGHLRQITKGALCKKSAIVCECTFLVV